MTLFPSPNLNATLHCRVLIFSASLGGKESINTFNQVLQHTVELAPASRGPLFTVSPMKNEYFSSLSGRVTSDYS